MGTEIGRLDSLRLDWFARALHGHVERENQLSTMPMSRAWAFARKEDVVCDMVRIRDAVRSIVRVHGVPPECRVALAVMNDAGAGAAGFADAPDSFLRPFILLDKTVYESTDPGEMMDVYCGIGLHEAGHVLHTRDFYRRARGLSARRRMWENLWEDERIEELVRAASPGFAPFLQAAKHALLEGGDLGMAIRKWDDLCDMDRLNTLIFAFIRCPFLIDERMQSWTIIDGERIFETLRAMFPEPPKDESDVEQFSLRLDHLWERVRSCYDKTAPKEARKKETVAGSLGIDGNRLRRQQEADAEDRALERAGSLADEASSLLEEAAALERVGECDTADRLFERALSREQGGGVADRAGRRFGLADLEQVISRLSTIQRPLTLDEAQAMEQSEPHQADEGVSWKWGDDRRTVILHPRPDAKSTRKYDQAQKLIRTHIAAMRAVVMLRSRPQLLQRTGLSEGRIDRRRLGRARATDLLFCRAHRREEKGGLALCLLLDESGSMKGQRAAIALQVAVLITESLRGIAGIELEIYSHTSCPEDHTHCLVRYLYGKRQTQPSAIGIYGQGNWNYDHQAILTAAKLFEQNTKSVRRVLLVISDGRPNGLGYGGVAAVEATHQAVETVRSRGIKVLNVAIADYSSEEIFGKAHVVKFTDLRKLVTDVKKLVTRIIRRSTEGC